MSPKTFIFYGASGSGKGTQALLLKKYLEKIDNSRKTLYMETGVHLRELAKDDSYTSHLTRDVIENGSLMPEFLPIWTWSNFLINNFTGKENLILDGLARRVDEAPVLDGALKFYKSEKPSVIILNVSDSWSTKRLTERGRRDDNKEGIKRRIDWYKLNVIPTIEFFRNQISTYNTYDINGEQTIEEVHNEIIGKLQNIESK